MLGTYKQRALVLLAVLIGVELFISKSFEIFSFRPDLFLIFIVFWSFTVNRHTAPQVALALGAVRDLFGAGIFGAEMFSYFLAGCFISMASLKIERQNVWLKGATCFIFSLFHFWIYAVVMSFFSGPGMGMPLHFWAGSFFHSVYTAVLAFWLMGFLEKCFYFRNSRILFNP